MITTIPSNNERFVIKLTVSAIVPLQLGIRVYDPRYANTYYFRRKATFTKAGGTREFSIAMPVSPKRLVLEVYDKTAYDDTAFDILNVTIEKMNPPKLWATDEQHRFLAFAIEFAQKAGYLPAGFYESDDHEFLFQYLPTITDAMGGELLTPARIHRKMPRVQISQRLFKSYTVPIRFAILAHEGCHWFLNTRDQTTADLCGMKHYLDYGFPKIEAVYAVTKIFGKHPEMVGPSQIKRIKNNIDFIEKYSNTKKTKMIV